MYTREQLHTILVANPSPIISDVESVKIIKSYLYLRRGVVLDIVTEFSEHDRALINIALRAIVRWVQ